MDHHSYMLCLEMRSSTLLAIPENTILLFVCPPKFCISIVFVFSWDHCKSQEKLETMLMQNLGGQTKSIMVFSGVAYMFKVFGLVSNPSDQIVSVIGVLWLLLKEPLNCVVEVKLCIMFLYHITFLILYKSCFATCKYFVSLIWPKKREAKISRLLSALPGFIKWLSTSFLNISTICGFFLWIFKRTLMTYLLMQCSGGTFHLIYHNG